MGAGGGGGSISRELSIESCKLASCRHSTVPVRAELVTTNCVASYLKERTIVNTIDFRVVGPSPTRSIPGYATGSGTLTSNDLPGPRPVWARV